MTTGEHEGPTGTLGVRSDAARSDPEFDRLLCAARTVMIKGGWWGFKVESVLREAGLSTRSFYRHFGSKNELLMTVMDDEMARVARRLVREVQVDATPEEALASWVRGTLAMAYEEPIMAPAVMFAEHWRELLAEFPTQMNAILDALIATIVPILERGRRDGTWPHVRPREDAFCVFYLTATLTADLAASGGARPRAQMVENVLPFVLRALGTSSSPTSAVLDPLDESAHCL